MPVGEARGREHRERFSDERNISAYGTQGDSVSVLPEMATGRQIGDFWSILEIYLLNGDFSRENLLSDGDFSANLF